MTLAIILLVAFAVVVGYRFIQRTHDTIGSLNEERRLIDRAAEGDEEASKELGRRAAEEEAALRARAVTDRSAARDYLIRKEAQLQAIQWADSTLEEKARGAGYSAERTAEVRARVESQLREVTRDIEWAKERANP